MSNGSETKRHGCKNYPELPHLQKATVLRALVADLSFWGDLNAFAQTNSPCKEDSGAKPATATTATATTTKMMPVEKAPHSSETRTIATTTDTLNVVPATTNPASSNGSTNNNGVPIWKTAVDAQSGKTYYYDVVSRRTQWEKVSYQLSHRRLINDSTLSAVSRIAYQPR